MDSELLADLLKAFGETFEMVGIGLVASLLLGLPLGLLLYVTERGLILENRLAHLTASFIVNVLRSIPFVILLVLLLPVTQLVLGTTIGPLAASVPLAVAAVAFYARLVHASLWEIERGVIEAATAAGATPLQIVRLVLLPESLPGLLRGLTVTAVSLIGFSAMAGIVGGGGVGDLAIRFGYYRYETKVMVITVLVLIVLVQVVQTSGDAASRRLDRTSRD
ncbi:MAG TPA: methionine ABC transporter permease [Myxococcales bacterium]|nr:methionine ABC transporter permease [Myxococcales bacterium]